MRRAARGGCPTVLCGCVCLWACGVCAINRTHVSDLSLASWFVLLHQAPGKACYS